ncbi:MAG: tRNA dihydrouridine synthase DusB, partial [Nitrospirota bacterium]|nr:tRNA dihydrouridine synthase DusB [Nitrospirota bacterium]
VLLEHIRLMEAHAGDYAAVLMRNAATWYCKGMPGAAELRKSVNATTTVSDMMAVVKEFFAVL